MQQVFLSLCRLEICLVSVCSGCEGNSGGGGGVRGGRRGVGVRLRYGGAVVTCSRGHDFNGAVVAGFSASVVCNSSCSVNWLLVCSSQQRSSPISVISMRACLCQPACLSVSVRVCVSRPVCRSLCVSDSVAASLSLCGRLSPCQCQVRLC